MEENNKLVNSKVRDLLTTLELIGLTPQQVQAVRNKVWDCVDTAVKLNQIENQNANQVDFKLNNQDGVAK